MRVLRNSRSPISSLLMPRGDQREHLPFAVAEVGEITRLGAVLLLGAEERAHLREEHLPGGLTLLEHVVVALERHEAGVREHGRQAPPLLVRDRPVLPPVEDERGLGDAAQRVR